MANTAARIPSRGSVLAHYTNLAGFVGVVESSTIRASNVAFLNDREELLHGLKCAKEALSRMLKDAALKDWKAALGKAAAEIESGRLPNTYAACFCEKSDLLSQWRGYGGREQGVCLVFDRKGLDALRPKKKSFLTPVQYGFVRGKSAMRQSLKDRLLAIEADDLIGLSAEERRTHIFDLISEMIPRFKHIGFSAEYEWRLVVQHETLRNSVKFRPSGNILIPYIEIAGGVLPLKYVRVGPGNDVDLTVRSVQMFLEANGYDVPVRTSSVPFRG